MAGISRRRCSAVAASAGKSISRVSSDTVMSTGVPNTVVVLMNESMPAGVSTSSGTKTRESARLDEAEVALRDAGLQRERELALMTPTAPVAEEIAERRGRRPGLRDGSHGRTLAPSPPTANYLTRN